MSVLLSVTEIEVTDGILEGENPNQHALCYMRDYSGLTQDKLSEQNALRNIDGMKVDGKVIGYINYSNSHLTFSPKILSCLKKNSCRLSKIYMKKERCGNIS